MVEEVPIGKSLRSISHQSWRSWLPEGIDALVYELYGLTDEEIKIVEEGTP